MWFIFLLSEGVLVTVTCYALLCTKSSSYSLPIYGIKWSTVEAFAPSANKLVAPRVVRNWEGFFLSLSVFCLTPLLRGWCMGCCDLFLPWFTWGSAVWPWWQQGFMLWFKAHSRSSCLFESHSNMQTSCLKESLFKHIKHDYRLLVVKSFASNQQPSIWKGKAAVFIN